MFSSMQWMVEPTGMLRIGRVLPTRIGASGAADDGGADFQVARSNDVATLAVGVAHQSDVGRTVGVVFNALDLGGDTVLVALEVHHTVVVLVTTALVASCDVTVVVTTGLLELSSSRGRADTLVQVVASNLHRAALAGVVGLSLITAMITQPPRTGSALDRA
jgi:hypothetical protein